MKKYIFCYALVHTFKPFGSTGNYSTLFVKLYIKKLFKMLPVKAVIELQPYINRDESWACEIY